MLKNVLALGKFSQSKIRGVWGVSKAFSRKFLKPLLRCSLVDMGGYNNSCNPQPAQNTQMLKKARSFLYFFQTALQTPQTPYLGVSHEQC